MNKNHHCIILYNKTNNKRLGYLRSYNGRLSQDIDLILKVSPNSVNSVKSLMKNIFYFIYDTDRWEYKDLRKDLLLLKKMKWGIIVLIKNQKLEK